MRENDCRDSSKADAKSNFFPLTIKNNDKREPGLFKEELRCIETLCLCSKLIAAIKSSSNIAAKD